jgi:hypothetical protein
MQIDANKIAVFILVFLVKIVAGWAAELNLIDTDNQVQTNRHFCMGAHTGSSFIG